MTFHLMCVHIIFSSVRLLSGHLLGNWEIPAGFGFYIAS